MKRLVVCGWLLVAGAMATGAAPILLKSGTIDPQGQAVRPKVRLLATAPVAKSGLYIIQHEGAIPPGWRRQLKAAGARIRGYVPENAYIIEVSDAAYAKVEAVEHAYLGAYRAEDRIEPTLLADDEAVCAISLFDAATRETVRDRLASVPGAEAIRADGKCVRARLSAAARGTVAGWREVEFITPYAAAQIQNNVAVGDAFMNVRTVWLGGEAELGLSGTGQVVAVADTGLDSGNRGTLHPDFEGQVLRAYALARPDDWSDRQGHGTHVAGSVLGTGAVSNDIRGVAWGAKLIMQSAGGPELEGLPDDLNVLFNQAYAEEDGLPGARIHSNSWNFSPGARNALPFGWYSAQARDVDEFTFSHPDLCILFSAGNTGKDVLEPLGVVDGNSLSAPATAKNCITVGASESFRPSILDTWNDLNFWSFRLDPLRIDRIAFPCDTNHQGMAAFSGRGPCQDGRIKPDVVAPGTSILSTKRKVEGDEGHGYAFDSGTSMSTPLTAGASALVREWLGKRFDISNPDGATVKAVLMAGAQSLAPGQYGTGECREIPAAYPNNVEGWGQVNVGRSVASDAGIVVHDACVIAHGEVHAYRIRVKDAGRLAVVLAYADAPASLAASRQLVNDLDLEVKTPTGKTTYPNSLNGPDRVNNVEGVRFESAEPGEYVITVRGTDVNTPMGSDLTGRDDAIRYSLVVNGAAEEGERHVSRTFTVVGEGAQLQTVIDAASEGDCIFVGAGTYAPVVNETPGILVCAQNPTNPPVIDGKNVARCITSVSGAIFRGFVLRNGMPNLEEGDKGGGVFGGRLENCVIEACKAGCGGGAACAELVNCRVTKNAADEFGGGVYDCRLVNCTVVGNAAKTGRDAYLVGKDKEESCALNCILDDVDGEASLYRRCFIGGNPGFVDAVGENYRLADGSPCINAGYDGWVDVATDLDGKLRMMGAAVDLGCYEFRREFGFAERDLQVSAPSQMVSVVVMTTENLSVRSDRDWLVPLQKQMSGSSGSVCLELTVGENMTGVPRTGRVTLCGADGQELDTLSVTQAVGVERGSGTYFALIAGSAANVALVEERCLSSRLWHPDRIRTIAGESVSKTVVTETLCELAKTAVAGDVVLYYQSCPAEHDEGCDPHSVRLRLGDGWMSPLELREALSGFDSAVTVVVIVEASFAAGLFRGDVTYGENVAFITASDWDQEIPEETAAGGAFTRTLCAEWASEHADCDFDGRLNFLELWAATARLADCPPDCEARCSNKPLLQGRLANVVAYPNWMFATAEAARVDPETFAWMVAKDLRWKGYPEEIVANLTTYEQYLELAKWSETTGVTPAEQIGSAAPLLSAALWADGLLDVSNASVRIEGFAPAAGGLGWTLKVGLDAYDPRMLNSNLLQIAIGAVGAEVVGGDYTSDGLEQAVRPTQEHVEIDIRPPADKGAFFLKGVVR